MADMRQVHLGVGGAGFMGSLHASVLAQLRGVRVAAIVDPDGTRASTLANQVGARAYPCVEAMLDNEEALDGIVIATPEVAHRSAVELVAARRCAVLVEKPIATSLADADGILSTCADAGVPLLVGHILRFE